MRPTTTTGHRAPIPANRPRPTVHHALDAEHTRAQLAHFWDKPLPGTGIPLGMDLLFTMFDTATGQALTFDRASHLAGLCASNAAAYRTSEVWVAPHTMGQRMTAHPYLSGRTITAGNLEDLAPARDGLVYFPTPIHLSDLHPVHGLAWHMSGTGDDLTTDFETLTATPLVPTRLPLPHAYTLKLPRTPYCPNGLATLHRNVLHGYSNAAMLGAPAPPTILALLLAFWDLRRPAPHDTEESGDRQITDEDVVTIPQHPANKHRRTGRNKRGGHTPARRRIRVIREPAHTPGPGDPAGPGAGTPGPAWKDDTLRWEVRAKSQNRCPNPHQHRAIIEAGGECKPVSVPVKAHVNGPKGRDIDPRRTVRIVPESRGNTAQTAD